MNLVALELRPFEVGRLDAMTAAGLPFSALLKQGYAIVAVDIYVQYKAPAFADDVLDLQSWMASFRSAVMTWHQTLSRHATGELLALAEVTGAFTRADGRPTRIPPHIRTLFDAIYVPEAAWPDLRRGRFAPS